jgi:ABC-2 type transport system permease protein
MTLAIFKVMLLALLRDRGAMAMAFMLPPLIYIIFAAIFSGTAGSDLSLRVAVLDPAGTEVTERLSDAIGRDGAFRKVVRLSATREQLEAMLRRDEADVGIIIRHDPTDSRNIASAPVVVIADAGKAVASSVVAGHIQRLFGASLPDAMYRRTFADIELSFVTLSQAQRARVDATIEAVRKAGEDQAPDRRAGAAPLVEQTQIASLSRAPAPVVYYAGAVGILFLLLSAVQGAMSLIDERQNGVLVRLANGGSGALAALVAGKFLFLVLQGMAQVGLILTIAAAVYKVDIVARFLALTIATVAAAAAASGLALLLAAACRSRQQAQTLANALVLIISALGGSMVPRFLMPGWLQTFSWVMPNSWAIEAYHGILWRNAPASELALPIGLLAAFALVGLMIAIWIIRRDLSR